MRPVTKSDHTIVDLFCGCGGMSWGLRKAGFKILAGIDNWADALQTFEANHKGTSTYLINIKDLRPQELMHELNLKRGHLDCLIGGPPCQGFSKNVPARPTSVVTIGQPESAASMSTNPYPS